MVALSGGKVQDAIRELEDCTEPLNNVFLCIGTNDCGRNEFDENAFAEEYRTLIDVAKEKTPNASNVHVVVAREKSPLPARRRLCMHGASPASARASRPLYKRGIAASRPFCCS